MASARQHPPMDHQHQQERPSVARAHSFPPPLQPSASSSSSSVRPSASSPASGSHPNAYHPYASSPKKPLLFINTVPPTDASVSTKPKRKRIMPEQLKELCALFDITDSPSFDAREKVGQAVGMTNREGEAEEGKGARRDLADDSLPLARLNAVVSSSLVPKSSSKSQPRASSSTGSQASAPYLGASRRTTSPLVLHLPILGRYRRAAGKRSRRTYLEVPPYSEKCTNTIRRTRRSRVCFPPSSSPRTRSTRAASCPASTASYKPTLASWTSTRTSILRATCRAWCRNAFTSAQLPPPFTATLLPLAAHLSLLAVELHAVFFRHDFPFHFILAR